MRLPTYKVYRAFPELDRFSDEACERYVVAARRGRRRRLVVAPLALGLGGAMLLFLTLVAAVIGLLMVIPGLNDSPAGPLLLIGAIALPGGAAALIFYAARDVLLRRVLERLLGLAACPGCRYSLLGLRIDAGKVSCPECGRLADVRRDLALEEDQLLAGEIPSRPFASSGEPAPAGAASNPA